MQPFKFTNVSDAASAIKAASSNTNSRFIAGGTNLLDLMKEGIVNPTELIDISHLNLAQIKATGSGISIGSLAKNTETANHPLVRRDYPLLTQAILSGASAQIRNMATNGGNIMQRTRCPYFYEVTVSCNKREPGSGCSSREGMNRRHSIFGYSDMCAAVHPSDMCVALAALDATVNILGPDGKARSITFTDFHRLPGDTPELDNELKHGELITSIDIPRNKFAANSYYLKVGDRASFSFAIISVGAALEMNGNIISAVRLAMGGVAPKPWRAFDAEKFLTGKPATQENFKAAAALEMKTAKPLEHNGFKVELGKRSIVLALRRAIGAKG